MKFLDLLSQRYASPFFILQEFIQLNQLSEFILEVTQIIGEEKKEKFRWEFYLHKVFSDISYEDFLKQIKEPPSSGMTAEDTKNVVDSSRQLLDTFNFE